MDGYESIELSHNDVEYYVFFIMSGLENGNRDFPCIDEAGTTMPDGFYFSFEGCDQPPCAAFKSFQECNEAAIKYINDMSDPLAAALTDEDWKP